MDRERCDYQSAQAVATLLRKIVAGPLGCLNRSNKLIRNQEPEDLRWQKSIAPRSCGRVARRVEIRREECRDTTPLRLPACKPRCRRRLLSCWQRNGFCRIAKEAGVQRCRLSRRKRWRKTRFHFSRSRNFCHHSECAEPGSDLAWKSRIQNTMNGDHAARAVSGKCQSVNLFRRERTGNVHPARY